MSDLQKTNDMMRFAMKQLESLFPEMQIILLVGTVDPPMMNYIGNCDRADNIVALRQTADRIEQNMAPRVPESN